jgi:NADH-quinone oxidoreductase subunit J
MLLMTATKPDLAVFVVAAAMILLGAIGVVLSRNPVHAALSMIATLFGVAIAFVAQGAQFLAAVQVIVYAGAIVVLFLFVIMLLGVDRKDAPTRDPLRLQRPLAVIAGLATVGVLIGITGWSWNATGGPSQSSPLSDAGSNISKLADSIFTQYLFPFEITSILLVIAVTGAVVLARKPEPEPEPDEEFDVEEEEPELEEVDA